MPQKTIRQALNEALRQEMRRDPTIVVIGEDVAGGADPGARPAPPLPESALLTDVYVCY